MRWKLYWASLAAALFGTSLLRNGRKYKDRSRTWIAGKSLTDVVVSAGLCWVFPPLLIAFCVSWCLEFVKEDKVWQIIAGVLSGAVLAWISMRVLELLALFGVISADFLTEKLFHECEAAICDRRWGRMRYWIVENPA